MDHPGNEGYDNHHRDGQFINQESNLEADTTAGEPGIDRGVVDFATVKHNLLIGQQGEQAGNTHPDDRDPVCATAANHLAEQTGDDRTD